MSDSPTIQERAQELRNELQDDGTMSSDRALALIVTFAEAVQAQSEARIQERCANLQAKFDALTIAEVKVFGGFVEYSGRTGREQTELREAIAELLSDPPTAHERPTP